MSDLEVGAIYKHNRVIYFSLIMKSCCIYNTIYRIAHRMEHIILKLYQAIHDYCKMDNVYII